MTTHSTPAETVGQRIKAARLARGLSRRSLGALIDTHEATLARYEDGRVAVDVAQLAAIAEALGTTSLRLMGGRS